MTLPMPIGSPPSPTLSTFQVAGVFELLATQYGVSLFCDGMDDDLCFGLAIISDISLAAFFQQHQTPYNYLIVDGDPIWLVRRAVGTDLEIDTAIDQRDLIPPNRGTSAIQIVRTDLMSLPQNVEVSYIDPDRDYAVNTQSYRHPGAPVTGGKLSVSVATVLSADQARSMAAEILWRKWGSPLTLTFTHPDISYQPADILAIACASGETHVCQILKNQITPDRVNQIEAALLLTQQGVQISGGSVDGTTGTGGDDFGAWLFTAP